MVISFEVFRRWVANNLRSDRLVEFLCLNLVQIVRKFRIGIFNFGTNRLYLNSRQILESSERQCRICLWGSLRFWHITLIVILIMLREKEFWAHGIWWQYWLEWEKENAGNLERKPSGITLEWRQRPMMEWMWLQNLVLAKMRMAKRNARPLLIGRKGKR